MISSIVAYFNSWTMLINFVCHTTIFGSILYVAIHNRDMPNWILTPLWWLAAISGFTASTVIVQWVAGPENPISYWTLGVLGEISSHIVLAVISFGLFLQTIKTDLENRKKRTQ